MKVNINFSLILLFISLFINLIKSQIYGSYELIEDTYSYNGNCKASFNVIVYIESSIADLEKIYLIDSIDSTLYSSFEDSDSIYKFKQSNDTHTYYNFIVKCSELKSSSSYTNPLVFNIFSIESQNFNFRVDSIQFDYTCLSPPSQLNVNPNIFLSTPIKLSSLFSVRIDNLESPISTLDITPQDTGYPFTLEFLKSEKYYIQFNLVFDKTSTTTSFTSMVFVCSYGSSEGSFNLVLQSPISDLDSTLVTSDSQYPIGTSYSTNNNWDINNLVFVNVSGVDSNIFFYSIVSGYTSPSLDKNQRVRLVTGNYNSGQVLITSSFYPKDRYSLDTQQSTITTYLYKSNTPVLLNSITKENNKIDIGLSTITNQVEANDIKSGLSFINYIFTVDKYPFSYSFIVKYGNSDYFTPIYPYGIKSSISSQTIYNFPYSSADTNIGYSVLTDLMDNQDLASSASTDTIPPVIEQFTIYYPRGGNGLYAFLRIEVTDTDSGFGYLYYAGNYITSADIVSGDINRGTYEKRILVNFDTSCYYTDRAGNKVICQNSDDPYSPYYYRIDPTPLDVPRLVDYDVEFTLFEFEVDVYDVSEEARLVTVLLNYTTAQEDIPIQFFILDRVYDDKYIDYNSIESRYLMDKELGLFKITVLIPAKLCTGTVPYLFIVNGRKFEQDYFYTNYGNKANLNIVSNDCYELPPIITSIEYTDNTTSSNNILLNDVATLGWKVRIETKSYLKHAFISGVGNLDRQPYVFLDKKYDYDAKVDNVLLEAVWVFRGDRNSQTISIYNITLIDHRGFKSELIYNQDIEYINQNEIQKYPSPISPLFKVQDQSSLFSFTVSSIEFNNNVDTTPPELISITSDKESVEVGLVGGQSDQLSFSFSTKDNIGISNEERHYPIVYLESSQNFGNFNQSRLECSTSFVDITGNDVYNYRAKCIIPYGFGANSGGLAVSVFGIVDTSLNVAGFTSSEIKTSLPAGSRYFIFTAFTRMPVIESFVAPIGSSDKLTIFGRNLAIDSANTQALISFDGYSYSDVPIIQYSNVGLIVSVSSYSKSFIIKVSSDGIESNGIGVPPLIESSSSSSSLSSSESSNVECLDNCGGPNKGTCIQGVGCRCISPFSGFNCLFESIKVPKPPVNTTSPDSLNVFSMEDDKDIQLSTIVSVVAIRELDVYDKEINVHKFTNWDYNELSASSYSYSSGIDKNGEFNVSNIQVIMEWYEESKLITFGGVNFTINPSSLKYYVNIDSYPFDSQLNVLEVVIKTAFKSNENNVCSNKQFGKNDGQDYMTLSIGKYSFEGKFIKTGIIDNKIRVLSHRVLSNFTGTDLLPTSNEQYSYVAIQLGHYETSVSLDPNFGVLLNPSDTSNNSNESICSRLSKSSKLTSAQIAGIVVGSVGLIVILSLVVLFKLSKSIKCLRLKVILYRVFKR